MPTETNLVLIHIDPERWFASTDDVYNVASMRAPVGTVADKGQESSALASSSVATRKVCAAERERARQKRP